MSASTELSTLIRALEVAELDERLRGDGPFTVLAPTNAAFDALPDGVLEQLLADGGRLRRVLEHHIVEGRLMAADLLVAGEVQPLTGHEIEIDDLSVQRADVKARNGVVHLVDELLVPRMF
jgi:uncharacterized surface protein with fasciclin (FAS1) repeats